MFGKTVAGGLLVVCCAVVAQADVFNMGGTRDPVTGAWMGMASLETVFVGDAGNTGELSGSSAGGYGPDRVCGAVDYAYNIGKYEVTAGQYCEFLNAVAVTDTHGLYNTNMADPQFGCNIQRSGSSGDYSYSVASSWANRPVNYVCYWDACRFANWLHNGQPIGPQGASTTETGAYNLTSDGIANNTVVRNAGWKWAVTSEDEWYKAAYYKGGGTNAGYWDLPTRSDTMPGRDLADASGNNANYYGTPWPIDSGTYYRTVVGEFQNSTSPYGTFDQGGNVWEWNESILGGPSRGLRGGSYGYDSAIGLLASSRHGAGYPATDEPDHGGFRVASAVPEPGSVAMLGAIVMPLLCWWRKRA